jgi:hypothetical protein
VSGVVGMSAALVQLSMNNVLRVVRMLVMMVEVNMRRDMVVVMSMVSTAEAIRTMIMISDCSVAMIMDVGV